MARATTETARRPAAQVASAQPERTGPTGTRQRKCAGCGQYKDVTYYAHPHSTQCGACNSWSMTGLNSTAERKVRRAVGRNALRSDQDLQGKGSWVGFESQPFHRPGAMDAFALPSRMGNRLHYRDGRVQEVRP